ncbi:MAG: cyclic nucleotide-binding domain-containing protein [Verrucomicrobiota bacterium]|nr:cyclic nucleotide-binding domain-containing protein [Verrucomicrobiota bacterium]
MAAQLGLSDSTGLPTSADEIVLGFGLVAFALSIGHLWAASVLRGSECEVYFPRIKWVSLFPHFNVDTDDACMVGRELESAVALVRMAPLILLTGLCAWFAPEYLYVMIIGLFYITEPLTHGPLLALLRALFLRQRLATGRDFLFVQNRLFWSLFKLRISHADLRYWLIYGFYTLVWLIAIGWTHLHLFNLNAGLLLEQMIHNEALKWFNLGLLSVIGLILLISLFLVLWIIIKNICHFLACSSMVTSFQQHFRHPEVLQLDAVVSLLEKNLLFQNTDLETRVEFARRALSLDVKGGRYIIREGEEGDSLYVIYSGAVEVLRELVTGRTERVARLGPGEAFGEIALINHTTRTRSVRAISRTTLLALRGKDFDDILVSRYGGTKILEILQKRAFLSRIQMSAGWHPQAIERMAHISEFVAIPGAKITLQKGQSNSYFFIIYEGKFEVRSDGKRIAALGVGDFFGELSLMQNASTVADVYAVTESKCLRVHKNDFLKFICHDFLIGMQFEEIGSDRLNRQLYPVDKRSFEIMEPG